VLKVIIAEDEPGVLMTLVNIVNSIEGVSVIGTASSIADAYKLTLSTSADVIILDIHFPDGSGIDLAKKLTASEIDIDFVFVTVDPEFSLDAHELYSYDYILKPIDENRMVRTLSRLKNQKIESDKEVRHLLIKVDNESIIIEQDNIIFIEKLGKKIVVHSIKEQYETYGTLDWAESQLSENFFRSHKSYLINMHFVKKITQWNKSIYHICFHNTTNIAYLSRRKHSSLINKLT